MVASLSPPWRVARIRSGWIRIVSNRSHRRSDPAPGERRAGGPPHGCGGEGTRSAAREGEQDHRPGREGEDEDRIEPPHGALPQGRLAFDRGPLHGTNTTETFS